MSALLSLDEIAQRGTSQSKDTYVNEMQALHNIFAKAETKGHFVQFYKADEPLLNRNVGQFLWEGLLRGDGMLVIATPQRRESLAGQLTRLGADVGVALRDRQLAMLDAHQVLARFMVDGDPDWDRFYSVISDALRSVRPRGTEMLVRAYGEMVGVLWEAGQYDAAVLLEEYWNKILLEGGVTLFCGYPIDVFATHFERTKIDALLCAHTHCVAAGPDGQMDTAVHRAMDDVLGSKADGLRLEMRSSASPAGTPVPAAEGKILWLRKHSPEYAESIIARARDYYMASRDGLEATA